MTNQRYTASGSFELPCPSDEAFPLFTPRGEILWVPGWDPKFVHPSSGELELDQVFTTAVDDEPTIWSVVHLDRAGHAVEYVRVTPGSRLARVSVSVHATASGCRVDVRYVCTALTAAAEAELADFIAGFDQMLEEWRERTRAHLLRE